MGTIFYIKSQSAGKHLACGNLLERYGVGLIEWKGLFTRQAGWLNARADDKLTSHQLIETL